MSKTIKYNRFDSDEACQKRRPSSSHDRRKAKHELRVFLSSVDVALESNRYMKGCFESGRSYPLRYDV